MRSLAALGVENAQITSRRRPSSRGRDPTMSSRSAASAPRWKGHNRRCTASNRAKGTPMNKPTTELAYRDRVTGLQLTVDGSMQKVGMPKTDPPACAAIGCTVVDVVRLTDQLNMWSDDEGLYNSQANPHHQTGAPLPARHPTSLPPALLRHHDDPRFRTGSLAARGRPGLRGGALGECRVQVAAALAALTVTISAGASERAAELSNLLNGALHTCGNNFGQNLTYGSMTPDGFNFFFARLTPPRLRSVTPDSESTRCMNP